MIDPRASRLVVAVVACVALVGCGSTATDQLDARGVARDELGRAVSAGTDDVGSSPEGGTAAHDRTATGDVGRATAGGTGQRAASGVAAAPAPASSSVALPGITDDTVKIGVVVADTAAANSALAAFGAAGLTVGDLDAQNTALATYINERGGMGGRQIELVKFKTNVAANQQTNAQAACAHWTQDNEVFAVAGGGGQLPDPIVMSCLAEASSIFASTTLATGEANDFNAFSPFYWGVAGIEASVMGRVYADGLYEQGFFEPGDDAGPLGGPPKIGILYYDRSPFIRALEHGVIPALAGHGLHVAETSAIAYSTGPETHGSTAAAIQSAALKFAASGVERVLFLDTGASLAFGFMQTAQSQGYHPRYGFETGSNPQFLQQQSFARDQLPGSVGIGWQPAADVDTVNFPSNPARDLCMEIMRDAGQEATSNNDLAGQLAKCSTFFFLEELVDRMSDLTPAAIQTAGESILDAPTASAASIAEGFGPGRHWGARAYQHLHFVDACTCFEYLGSPRPA